MVDKSVGRRERMDERGAVYEILVRGSAIVVLVLLAGCDTSFEAFEETDRAYSIFGYLDANADTQFVRVEPLQDTTLAGSSALDAHVTAQQVGTGERFTWRDSTFVLGSSEVPVQNVWTAEDIEPNSTYRFRVIDEDDDAKSMAEVSVPASFPTPDVVGGWPNLRDTSAGPRPPTKLVVEEVKNLGAVRADYDYKVCIPIRENECNYIRRQVTASALDGATRTGETSWSIEVPWDQHIPDVVGPEVTDIVEIYSFHITVAAVGEDWPEYAEGNLPEEPSDQPLPPPGRESNIENGIGFLGGVFTRTLEVPVHQKR